MHIREPRDFARVQAQRRARKQRQKLRHFLLLLVLGVVGLCVVAYGAYLRPLPAIAAKTITPTVATDQVALAWPSSGQASVGAVGQGVLASTANQKPVPTASVAKVMTALAVLKKKPLKAGEAGPTLTMTAADVALYTTYANQGGSVVQIQAGEKLTEYQMLQAALLPSSNNLSDSLAIWAYGSMKEYHVAANQLAASLGMSQSAFAGDASGFLPETVSTPHDLVLLGQAALQDPVIKEIVAQKSVALPVVGTVSNVNSLLGTSNINGIKTGNSEQAGGCYLFSADRALSNGQVVTAVGAITASPSLGQAMTNSLPLLDSFYQGFTTTVVVPKGTVVARYSVPWAKEPVTAVTTQDTNILNWRGSKASVKVQATSLKVPASNGAAVGTLEAQSTYAKASVPVALSGSIDTPNWKWRINRR